MEDKLMEFYKNALLGTASDKPLCNDYKNEWRACGNNKDKLIKLALRQQSLPYIFTYSHLGKGLTKDYLLNEFGSYINGRKTIQDADGVSGYTYELDVSLPSDHAITTDVAAFMYCNGTNVNIQSTKCPTLYIGCKSDIHLNLDGFNSIRIHLYDESRVVIEDTDEESNVIVYKYSNDARVECGKFCLCEVKEFNKDLKLQL